MWSGLKLACRLLQYWLMCWLWFRLNGRLCFFAQSRQSKLSAERSVSRRLKEVDQSSDERQTTAINSLNETSTNIIVPDMSAVHKYVVRPAPVPPPPRYVQLTTGTNHPLEHSLWVRVFSLLEPTDLVRCMRVCKAWNRWGYDRQLWTSIDLIRCRLRQTHLIGIVRRQPKSLDLSWTNVSHRQLAWLVERLPHLRKLRLAGNSWPAVSALCGCRCPLLSLLDIAWVAVVYDGCVRDLLSPPRDHRPGLDVSLSRLRRCTELVLAGSDITNDALESVAQHLPALERLDLSYCVGIDNDGLRLLSEAAASQTLNTIRLTGCVCLSSACFVYLARFPRLREVAIQGCQDITEKDCCDFMALQTECTVLWKEHYKRVD